MDNELRQLLNLCDKATRKYGITPAKTVEIMEWYNNCPYDVGHPLEDLDAIGSYLEDEKQAMAKGLTIDEYQDTLVFTKKKPQPPGGSGVVPIKP